MIAGQTFKKHAINIPIPICFPDKPIFLLRMYVPIIKYIILMTVLLIVLLTSSSSLNCKNELYLDGTNTLCAIANNENAMHAIKIGIIS